MSARRSRGGAPLEHPRRPFLAVALGVLTASAVVLTSGVAAQAAAVHAVSAASGAELLITPVSASAPFAPAPAGALPVVESEIGRGAPLAVDPASTVDLGPAARGAASALVRVAALSPAADLTVYGAGAPILEASAGHSQSTAVLLPVTGGTVPLFSSAPVATRIEVLATFGADTATPGATTALPLPVTRADTASGLGGGVFAQTPVAVGLVGAGGVPSDDVRAVYATVTVDAPAATVLELDTQRIPIGAGRTVLTTVLTPDADGGTTAHLDSGSGTLRLDVRGWVRDAPDNVARSNVTGGFVPATGARADEPIAVTATQDAPVPVELGSLLDADYTLALVTAGPALTPDAATGPAGETTTLELGDAYRGRARGILVDGEAGGAAQLVLTPVHGGASALDLRRGTAPVSIVPLGDFLGQPVTEPASDAATITIDSHTDGQAIDLGEHGSTELSGAIDTRGASVDRVEISGPEGLIGTADLTMGADDALTWSYDVSSPVDGLQTFVATVVDRAGNSTSADVGLDMKTVDATDTVIAPDVAVPNAGTPGGIPRKVSATELVFPGDPGLAPGDVVAAAEATGSPDGAFARVVAVDRVGDEWRVTIANAALTDVFRQADVFKAADLDQTDPSAIDESARGTDVPGAAGENDPATGEPATDELEFLPGDHPAASVVTGGDVDLDGFEQEAAAPLDDPAFHEPDVGDPDLYGLPAGTSAAADGASAAASGPALRSAAVDAPDFATAFSTDFNVKVAWKNELKPTAQEITRQGVNPPAELEKVFRQMVQTGEAGFVLSNETQAAADLTFRFRAHMVWRWGVYFDGVVIDELTVKLHSSVKSSGSVKLFASTERSYSISKKRLAEVKLPTITFFVGPVPVVITNTLGLSFAFGVKFTAAAVIPYGTEREDTYGFTYSTAAGAVSLASHPGPTVKPFTAEAVDETTKLQLGAQLSAGPEVSLASKLYGITGPEFSLSGKLVGKLGLETPIDLSWGRLDATVSILLEFAGSLKVELFSKVLADLELFTLDKEFPLFTRSTAVWGTLPAPPVKPAVTSGSPGSGPGPGPGAVLVPQSA